MKVLNLVTTRRSFYRTQEAALEAANIDYTTLTVPGTHHNQGDKVEQRSVWDYLRYYPSVLRNSFSGYDIIHANFGLTAPFAIAQLNLPVVVSLWGSEFYNNKYESLIRSATKRADEVIIPSKTMGQFIDRDCHCIPYPIDSNLFSPMKQKQARQELGWELDETIVLFPAAPGRPEKNYERAKRITNEVNQPVRLYPCINEPYEKMPLLMNASDAVLVTSNYESGPMVVKEAVACNVPVVSTSVGFVPDTLEDISNSYTARHEPELAAALESVLENEERSDGRYKVEKYTISQMGDQLQTVYDQCLGKTQSSTLIDFGVSSPSRESIREQSSLTKENTVSHPRGE